MEIKLLVLALALTVFKVNGDVYMQNFRGSNNRLDEAKRARNNANRLFDSQNNNRGGYNVGPGMEYYVGSEVRIEWTNQHSCGNVNNNCEVIVQYMCDPLIRDGQTTKTIPDQNGECYNGDCNTDFKYGMQENYEYYQTCKYTQRNPGLYLADQKLRGNSAKYTRQNNNGNRHGYECPEERDYYPYWRPSPWKDAVIFTNNVSRCDYYKQHSQNVESRFHCKVPQGYLDKIKQQGHHHRNRGMKIPITQDACEKITFGTEKAVWTEVPAWGIDAPECKPSPKNRGNHNGNAEGGETNHFMWKIPDDTSSQCVFRIRYNISTNDFDSWATRAGSQPPIYGNMEMHETTAEEHGYQLEKSNPIIHPMRIMENGQNIAKKFKLRLAMNLAQFGRTFQDRSHAMMFIPRPSNIPISDKIVNLNVRGKRGNIVQTYPGTEYDFVPETLKVKCDETWIHIQWTGADSNPRNNAGQGQAGTDRSNICLLRANKYVKSGATKAGEKAYGHYASSYPDTLGNTDLMGLSLDRRIDLCASGSRLGDNSELDNAGPYYNHKLRFPQNGGLIKCRCEPDQTEPGTGLKVKIKGVWYILSTRNNNFTNRSQKGKIICE